MIKRLCGQDRTGQVAIGVYFTNSHSVSPNLTFPFLREGIDGDARKLISVANLSGGKPIVINFLLSISRADPKLIKLV